MSDKILSPLQVADTRRLVVELGEKPEGGWGPLQAAMPLILDSHEALRRQLASAQAKRDQYQRQRDKWHGAAVQDRADNKRLRGIVDKLTDGLPVDMVETIENDCARKAAAGTTQGDSA